MAENQTALSALERNWEMVTLAVAEVDEATMVSRPNDDSNSMSWLIWHMTRVADRFIHFRLTDKPQLWTADVWHDKFNMPDDPHEFGLGWSDKRVAVWQSPPKAVVMAYFHAVNSVVIEYFNSLTERELRRVIPFPALPDTMTVGEALGNLVWDNIAHGGQVAYLRGYYRGIGWHR